MIQLLRDSESTFYWQNGLRVSREDDKMKPALNELKTGGT